MPSSGYSGTPLAKKLGIKHDFLIYLVNEPSHYLDLFSDLPGGLEFRPDLKELSLDFIHVFVRYEEELLKVIPEVKPLLKKTGMLWVSWPKGSSKLKADINRESVREYGLSCGLVDIKVCAIDEDWSALKFVYRVVDR